MKYLWPAPLSFPRLNIMMKSRLIARGLHSSKPCLGALLGKPYNFTARPWELKHFDGVDPHDAMGTNISIHTRGTEVMRVIARENDAVNELLISDKVRYSYDGLKTQRLIEPMIRVNGVFEAVSWKKALRVVAEKLTSTPGDKIAGVAGNMCDAESMLALKDLMAKLNASVSQTGGDDFDPAMRANYVLNSTLYNLDDSDLVLLVGVNIQEEAPILNVRLRRLVSEGTQKVAYVGPATFMTYAADHLGITSKTLGSIADGSHPFLNQLKSAVKPSVIVSANLFKDGDAAGVYAALSKIRAAVPNLVSSGWNGANILHLHSGRVGGLELGLRANVDLSNKDVLYLLGADEIDESVLHNKFVIYQGHHGDVGAQYADIILPGQAFPEKTGIYVNTEGRVQQTDKAINSTGLAREDWMILRAVSEASGVSLPYDTREELMERMLDVAPALVDSAKGDVPADAFATEAWKCSTSPPLKFRPYTHNIKNFWMTDSISRASLTMSKQSDSLVQDSFPVSLVENVQFIG